MRERKSSDKSGGSQMHNKAAAMRYLIIDEISTAALYVLGILEKHVTVARQGMFFAADIEDNMYAWGGVNSKQCLPNVSFAIPT